MKNTKQIELKVGIVSVVGTILLVLGLILGRGYKVSVSTQTIKFRFPNSGGLQVSSPVVVNGVKRGTVTSVVNDNGSVLVTATIDNIDDLRKDVKARITILEITGGKKIEIFPGTSPEKFNPETEIQGETAADFADLVTQLGLILEQAKHTISQLDTTLTSTNKVLGNKNFATNLQLAVDNATQTLTITREILEQNQTNINQIVKNLKEILSELRNDYSIYEPKINRIVTRLDTISFQTTNLLENGSATVEKINRSLNQLNDILLEIREGDNLANKIIYNKEFAQRLDSTLRQVSELITFIQKNGVNVNLRLGTRP
ncbi:MCE family protein [Bacteroidetes/Chlorobi group bacterium MS-B_bin-24]|jgi:phospholipid/cholesterol/gamma-HCH transport system substrate-binding protein|nr:MAG: MCE family protein [Bacteroidetes/Chlorobi group bacterium MS-B_bin-24]